MKTLTHPPIKINVSIGHLRFDQLIQRSQLQNGSDAPSIISTTLDRMALVILEAFSENWDSKTGEWKGQKDLMLSCSGCMEEFEGTADNINGDCPNKICEGILKYYGRERLEPVKEIESKNVPDNANENVSYVCDVCGKQISCKPGVAPYACLYKDCMGRFIEEVKK